MSFARQEGGLSPEQSFAISTGEELITNLTVSPDGALMACGSMEVCKLLSLAAPAAGAATEDMEARTLASFTSDFRESSAMQNVVQFDIHPLPRALAGARGLFTGGEDGALRMWLVKDKEQEQEQQEEKKKKKEDDDEEKLPQLTVTMQCESLVYGESKPLGAIAIHPLTRLVATASKDKACRIYSYAHAQKGKKAALKLDQTLDLRGKGSTELRSCLWAPGHGDQLFVLENCSGRGVRKRSYVAVYSHGCSGKQDIEAALHTGVFSLQLTTVQEVHDEPSTAIALSPLGTRLAVGGADGKVSQLADLEACFLLLLSHLSVSRNPCSWLFLCQQRRLTVHDDVCAFYSPLQPPTMSHPRSKL